MLTNSLHPALLARVLAGLAASGILLAALRLSWALSSAPPPPGSEQAIALERRAELVAGLVRVALGIQVIALALTVFAADRLHGSLRGAMCAYGVFASTESGFAALGTSAIAAMGGGLWLALHEYDLELPRPTLTRRKFRVLFAMAPIALLDLGVTLRFFSELDLDVVASCCASQLDPAISATLGAEVFGAKGLGLVAILAATGAVITALVRQRRDGRLPSFALGTLGLVAATAGIPAAIGYVAPHVYASPLHACPFCLLHAEHAGYGWWLFGALGLALLRSLQVAGVELQTAKTGERKLANQLTRRLSRTAALAWCVTAALGVAPVLLYMMQTGADVFGGTR